MKDALMTQLRPARSAKITPRKRCGCSHCAIEHLPQLMADAIVGSLSIEQLQTSTGPTCEISKESRIRERFHSAFSSALIRKIRAT